MKKIGNFCENPVDKNTAGGGENGTNRHNIKFVKIQYFDEGAGGYEIRI